MMTLRWKISMVRETRIERKFNLTIKEQSEFRLIRSWRDKINSDWSDRLRARRINYHKARQHIVRLWIRVKWNRRVGRNQWGIWVGMFRMRRMLECCRIKCSRCENRWRRINHYYWRKNRRMDYYNNRLINWIRNWKKLNRIMRNKLRWRRNNRDY